MVSVPFRDVLIGIFAGSRVTLVEKRSNYTRNTWLDLGPNNWYSSVQWLEKVHSM